MEYDQSIISRFLFNDGPDPNQIAEEPATKFGENAYPFRTVQLRIEEVRRGCEDVGDISRSATPREVDLTAMI
jgi:hypothetical protein